MAIERWAYVCTGETCLDSGHYCVMDPESPGGQAAIALMRSWGWVIGPAAEIEAQFEMCPIPPEPEPDPPPEEP